MFWLPLVSFTIYILYIHRWGSACLPLHFCSYTSIINTSDFKGHLKWAMGMDSTVLFKCKSNHLLNCSHHSKLCFVVKLDIQVWNVSSRCRGRQSCHAEAFTVQLVLSPRLEARVSFHFQPFLSSSTIWLTPIHRHPGLLRHAASFWELARRALPQTSSICAGNWCSL